MKVFLARTLASMPSRPDNTLEVVAIPFAGVKDSESIVKARIAYPRAAIVTVGPAELAVDAARAGSHAHVDREEDVETAVPLARARKHAEAALLAKAHDAANLVGHELRNPLNVIAMTLAFVEEAADLAEDRRALHLEKVQRAVERMTTLLDDLAASARFDAGQFSLHIEPVPVQALVAAAFVHASFAAAQRSVTLASSIRDGLVVRVDRARVTRALTAVVEGVVAASRTGAEVSVEANEVDGMVAFTASASPPVGGARPLGRGVCLAAAARVVMAHGGAVWSEDADIRALTFTLPRAG